MSSTNRGHDRHKNDFYVTPTPPIREFLSEFLKDEGIQNPAQLVWLDPCAGGDDRSEMSYPVVIKELVDPMLITMDIREDSRADIKADYLNYKLQVKPDIIITNPPFGGAIGVINKAIEDVVDGGYVIMLLRLNFFGSQDRKPFFNKNMPKLCYVHHKRISFIPKHINDERKEQGLKPLTVDSIEYAHFVWQKGYKEKYTKLRVI
jgi:hypothetical protein